MRAGMSKPDQRLLNANTNACIVSTKNVVFCSSTEVSLACTVRNSVLWRVWRYQRGNQNPYIEEEQTTQWPKEKVQKDKQRSTKHTYKIKPQVTRTQLTTGGELRCSGRVSSNMKPHPLRWLPLSTRDPGAHWTCQWVWALKTVISSSRHCHQ